MPTSNAQRQAAYRARHLQSDDGEGVRLNLIIGTVTPPVGVVLFVVTRIAEISFETMSRAILSWLVPLLAVLALVTVWPPFTTWLPHFLAQAR